MRRLLFVALMCIPSLAFADRLGGLKAGADVALSSQTVQIRETIQTGATFYVSSGTVSKSFEVIDKTSSSGGRLKFLSSSSYLELGVKSAFSRAGWRFFDDSEFVSSPDYAAEISFGISSGGSTYELSYSSNGVATPVTRHLIHQQGGHEFYSARNELLGRFTFTGSTIAGTAFIPYGVRTSTLALTSLASQSCLGTDSNGNVQAGTCGSGDGGLVSPSTGIISGKLADGVKVSTGNLDATGTRSAQYALFGDNTWKAVSSTSASTNPVLQAFDSDLTYSTRTIAQIRFEASTPTANAEYSDVWIDVIKNGNLLTMVTFYASIGGSSQIRFNEAVYAPGGVLGSSSTLNFVFNGGGSVLASGSPTSSTACVTPSYAATISSWTFRNTAKLTGSISTTIRKASNNSTSFTSMSSGGTAPNITSNIYGAGVPTGWASTTFSAYDEICAEITSASTLTDANLIMTVVR